MQIRVEDRAARIISLLEDKLEDFAEGTPEATTTETPAATTKRNKKQQKLLKK